MTYDEEYIIQFSSAVEALTANGAAGLRYHGLCYGLFAAGFDDSYHWVAKFIGGVVDLPQAGIMTDLRLTILLILAELDDETILFFRDVK